MNKSSINQELNDGFDVIIKKYNEFDNHQNYNQLNENQNVQYNII